MTTCCRCRWCIFAAIRARCPRTRKQQRELARKLRDYLDRGGFLFAEGYCGGDGFNRGFRELMARVFANEPEYRLKLLDRSHPIWHAEEKVPPELQRPLLGIEFGCRTSVVYVPPDPPGDPRPSLSCLWELSRSGRQQQFTPAVQAQIDAARAIGINILAYATNRELNWNGEQPTTTGTTEPHDPIERGKIAVANLRHPGGCDAAPRALANLMEAAARELKIRVDVHPSLLSITDNALFDYHLVFMHGRNSFHLTDRERAQLKTYVERGGMILADSICANKAFTESFCREMAAIFPDHPLERIPADDPLLTTTYGFDLSKVSRRDPQPGGANGPLNVVVRQVPPDLQGDQVRRSLRGDLLALRFELRAGEARLAGVPGLQARGRRADRPQRAPLLPAAVTTPHQSRASMSLL